MMNAFIGRLEKFVENSGKRAAIINVDSIAGSGPSVFTAIYGGTKGHLWNLSLGVGEEINNHIDILSLAPGPVNTALAGFLKNERKWDPNTCEPINTVTNCLRDLGQDRVSHGYIFHEFFAHIIKSSDNVLEYFGLKFQAVIAPKIFGKINELK